PAADTRGSHWQALSKPRYRIVSGWHVFSSSTSCSVAMIPRVTLSLKRDLTPGRLRGPQLGWAVCSMAWTARSDPTWPSGIGWCSLLMCTQQGRTRGIATRLYVDSGVVGVSGHDD